MQNVNVVQKSKSIRKDVKSIREDDGGEYD